MSPVWSESFTVHTYEVDAHGRASIQSLCAFLQEAAGRNAYELGVTVPQLMEHGLTWVLSRLLVRVYAYPRWWETLVIETWPSGFRRLFALRDWRVFRGEDLLAEATSAWLMVDLAERRPIRPQSHGTWANRIHPERAISLTLDKLPAAPLPEADAPAGTATDLAGAAAASAPPEVHEGQFTVRYRDLDMNGHANNISYLDWFLEILPLELRREHTLRELEMNFLAEAGAGDTILSRALAVPSPPAGCAREFIHTLSRPGEGPAAARARTRWVPRE